MADPNQWMLDAGLRVVRGWGKRAGGSPSIEGTMYAVELSDGTFHVLDRNIAPGPRVEKRGRDKHSSRYEPLYGRLNYLWAVPKHLWSESLKAELDDPSVAEGILHGLRSASAKRAAATRRRNKQAKSE
jgi:hypothetical protein